MTPLFRGPGHVSRVWSIGFLAAIGAAFVAISPVLADTQLAHYGKTGVGTINEAQGDVVCNYDETSTLTSISIAAPSMFARDRTSGTDLQAVGWQVIVNRSGVTIGSRTYKLTIQEAQATDTSAAAFISRVFIPGPIGVAGETYLAGPIYYSVIIKMIWYKPDGRTVAGWSKHGVDFFTNRSPNASDTYPVIARACTWGLQ